jgi:hypothetical protein
MARATYVWCRACGGGMVDALAAFVAMFLRPEA